MSFFGDVSGFFGDAVNKVSNLPVISDLLKVGEEAVGGAVDRLKAGAAATAGREVRTQEELNRAANTSTAIGSGVTGLLSNPITLAFIGVIAVLLLRNK